MKAAASGRTVRLTVRLSARLYAHTQRTARARRTTVSGLVRQLVESLVHQGKERELTRAYNLLGKDAGSDVGPFFAVQAEVVRNG